LNISVLTNQIYAKTQFSIIKLEQGQGFTRPAIHLDSNSARTPAMLGFMWPIPKDIGLGVTKLKNLMQVTVLDEKLARVSSRTIRS